MKNKKQDITFEEAYEKAEEIVRELESGSMNLEEAVSSFEEAINLLKICRDKLNNAESRVKNIIESSTGPLDLGDIDINALNYEGDSFNED